MTSSASSGVSSNSYSPRIVTMTTRLVPRTPIPIAISFGPHCMILCIRLRCFYAGGPSSERMRDSSVIELGSSWENRPKSGRRSGRSRRLSP